MKRILVLIGVIAVGLMASCNNPNKDHSGRAGSGIALVATTSVVKVLPGGTFTLTETSGAVGVGWTQVSGPTATFPSGTTGSSVTGTPPTSGGSDFMELMCTASGRQSASVFVFFQGTDTHEAAITDTVTPAGSPDTVTVVLTRLDGNPVDQSKQPTMQVIVELPGETIIRNSVLLSPTFDTTVSLGLDSNGAPIKFLGVNMMTTRVLEHGIEVAKFGPLPPGGNNTNFEQY